jgi:cholesterol oxidase
VRKAVELREAASRAGYELTTADRLDPARRQWFLPKLAVTFANEDRPPSPGETITERVRNLHDRDRQTCVLCGECDIGCNVGAKNTLDYNFLTRARNAAAVLRPLAEVTGLSRRPGGSGYRVSYLQHPEGRPTEVDCRHLVLAAGTLGTSRLLLGARATLGRFSPMLGHRFSGNGDLLTLAASARHSRSEGGGARVLDAASGPVITSALRSPDERDGAAAGARGLYVEDGGYPAFLAWLADMAPLPGTVRRELRFSWRRLLAHLPFVHHDAHAAPALEGLLADSQLSADSVPLLAMGLDEPSGRLELDGSGELALRWTERDSRPFLAQALAAAQQVAKGLGAELHENPLSRWRQRFVTVHPLGGCPMGETPDDGVVDSWGRVYGHPGLHVADGSVMPGPVGANPSLTIAALAHRFADALVEDLSS